jgi:hypothetical protein
MNRPPAIDLMRSIALLFTQIADADTCVVRHLHKQTAVRQAAAGNIAIGATIGMLFPLLEMQLPTPRGFRGRKLQSTG